MRILFSSDWQAEYENLQLCQKAADEIKGICSRLGVGALVLCGDLKHQYNPIDTRVVTFWLRTIESWKKGGLHVWIDLGNHDRVGIHVDKQNWFPILRRSGAKCFDEPDIIDLGGKAAIAFLPFRTSGVLLRREAMDLSRGLGNRRGILVFHGDIKSARYNVLESAQSVGDVSVGDICAEKYVHCVGGHIHLQQKVSQNVWYVGSPFATDWGEANQRKGYLLYDTATERLGRVRSSIPGWYDPSWPGFKEAKPASWEGARIRINVNVSSTKHITEELRAAKEKAELEYEGADVVIRPVLHAVGTAKRGIRLEDSDRRKIEIYTDEMLPAELKQQRKEISDYMAGVLAQGGGMARDGGLVKFKSVRAENFLSFKKLEYSFEPGLHVITGENQDRRGKSNGAGKSSYLQPLAVALFGQTFKGQKHDHWANRWEQKGARCKVWLTDAQNRAITVERKRKPAFLQLRINKEVIESGNRPEDTQRLIEQTIGYTWETLANAIYIDQTRAHLMLSGTEGERKTFLAKLQNLERFERARKRVNAEKQLLVMDLDIVRGRIATATNEISSLTQTIDEAKEILALGANVKENLTFVLNKYESKKYELLEWEDWAKGKLKGLDEFIGSIKEKMEHRFKLAAHAQWSMLAANKIVRSLEKLGIKCETCQSELDEKKTKELIKVKKTVVEVQEETHQRHMTIYAELQEKLNEWNEKRSKYLRNKELGQEVANLRDEYIKAKETAAQYEKQQVLIYQLKDRIVLLEEQLKSRRARAKDKEQFVKQLEFMEKAFSRNGLPAYLNAQVCPLLNLAAQKYSDLFTQSEIQVRFEVDEEGALDVQVLNVSGGEGVEDQSEGELKMASLITSFAVREAAPKTNLLILDEPGHGLDALSAKQFARALKIVAQDYQTVLLTSHNEHILNALEGADIVKVIKHKGESSV